VVTVFTAQKDVLEDPDEEAKKVHCKIANLFYSVAARNIHVWIINKGTCCNDMPPPPFIWRCNGSSAGLGYLEAIWIVLEKTSMGKEPVSASSCCRIWTA
jgi:hypothetical protein